MLLTSRVTVYGREHIPSNGGFIIASNHLGRLDAPLVYYLFEREDVTLMVAEKYQANWLFRWGVKQVNAMWVDRFNADMAAMRQAMQRLKAGGVLVMAPEGTRSPTQALIAGRPGASYLAAKTGLPVLPVALTGTEDRAVVRNLKRLRRASVVLRAGPVFVLPPLTRNDREAQLQKGTDEIMCRIAALLPESYRGIYARHPRLQELLAQTLTPNEQPATALSAPQPGR
ncbi:MAG TPA: lysophospholipid acyltransferase family protein [Anaerolineales bacterium]|nr:lysophospholipid acyltransferase family protein [Anaerolineales bacterium]